MTPLAARTRQAHAAICASADPACGLIHRSAATGAKRTSVYMLQLPGSRS